MNKQIKEMGIRFLPLSLIKWIRGQQTSNLNPFYIYNIGIGIEPQKKVLISYVTEPFFQKEWKNQNSTRNVECAAIIKAFLMNGCRVDVCNLMTTEGIRTDYDIIIGSGIAYRLACKLNPNAKQVLYLTEKTPKYSSEKEDERIDYLNKRHSIRAKKDRSGLYYIQSDIDNCDKCIMIGRKGDEILIEGNKTFIIYPTGLTNKHFKLYDRNVEKSKKHFLWLGSRGAIHKGLDILLDVFAMHPELTLHVAGLNAIDKKILRSIIPSNVIDHGFVHISSEKFKDIANKCAFIVSVSCSEGVSTSVITAMNHGMIPLITEETSVEIGDCGEYYKSFKVNDVEKTILKWSNMDNNTLIFKMETIISKLSKNYDLEAYSNNIRLIVSELIKE